jgi:hypothetical protein
VSVESAREPSDPSQSLKADDIFLSNISDLLLGNALHNFDHTANPGLLQANPDGTLDTFAYQDEPFDASFNDPFGGQNAFAFDDFIIDDPVTLAID